MFQRYYAYYVTYSFNNGGGSLEITRTSPIKTMDDINSMRDFIEFEYDRKSVIVTNWIRIKPRKDSIKLVKNNKR